MRTITLSELRTEIRQLVNIENSQHIKDPELTTYINAGIAELYDLLVKKYGADYFMENASFSLVKDQDTYDLPTNFFKLKGVDLSLDSSRVVALEQFTFAERNVNKNYNGILNPNIKTKYRLSGNKIIFSPVPKEVKEIKLWYVPHSVKLVNGTDTFNGYNGWEDYVIIYAAIRCKIKREESINELMELKGEIKQNIESASETRDAGDSPTWSSVRTRKEDDWWF